MNKEDLEFLENFINQKRCSDTDYSRNRRIKTLTTLIESNKQMESDLKELIHDNSRYIKTNSELATESEYRAEVINKRDGTIKQLQKRIRTLEKPDNITHSERCECKLCLASLRVY